ncbi:MAG: SNF2-related protein, partial [Candidatus Binataceae bacterium]
MSSKPARKGRWRRRARAALDRPPSLQGWRTTDEDEVALRRWRGRTEIVTIEALESKQPFFGTFRVQSGSGAFYEVEIRDLNGFGNSCGCIDHRANGLGTCKHIEGVLAALRQRSARAFREVAARGTSRIEVFLDRRGAATPALMWPAASRRRASAASRWLAAFIEPDGTLACDPNKVEALVSAWRVAPAEIRRLIRVSRHFGPWLGRLRREHLREEARASFLAEVKDGAATFDVLHHPLLPYQREGMLHLAFGERVLLADEMGLGKTVQAIAACELLARRKSIQRVLVVCPASLKAEWEEQIARFTDRPARSVFGARPARLATYREPSFFTIVNYEQVLGDAADINEILHADVVVLDEAQRIKNWQIKTARRVKSLRSTYAFVLTGTPVENRIDELYSIVQYLDPELVGPLFRFNRDFYELDERGRPVDYKNLGELRRRLQPVMLRRRKSDVEAELPGRTMKTYFVPMVEEQAARYEEYKNQAARLLALAQRRPLIPKEFDRLQMLLACMRMICDTPAILDPTCRVSPKLEELEGILSDLLEEPERKIIVFSEWERMLELVRELAAELGVEAA